MASVSGETKFGAMSKVTTFGDPVESHIDAINRKYLEYRQNISEVHEYLRFTYHSRLHDACRPIEPRSRPCMTVVMTPYCKEGRTDLLVAEFGVVVFSVERGVIEAVSGLVDPGYIPLGERGEVTSVCEAKALPFPKSHKVVGAKPYGPKQVLDLLKQMVDKYQLKFHNDIMIFATRGEVGMIMSCMAWLRRKANELGDASTKYTYRSLEVLLMELSLLGEGLDENGVKFSPEGIIEHEGGSARFIFNQRYDFEPKLACNWHIKTSNVGKTDQCAGNIALRRVYNCLFYLAHLLGFPLTAPAFLPPRNSREAKMIFLQGSGMREDHEIVITDEVVDEWGCLKTDLPKRMNLASLSRTAIADDDFGVSESSAESDEHGESTSSTDTTRGYSSDDFN